MGIVKFWDSKTCTQLSTFQAHGADVLCLSVGPVSTFSVDTRPLFELLAVRKGTLFTLPASTRKSYNLPRSSGRPRRHHHTGSKHLLAVCTPMTSVLWQSGPPFRPFRLLINLGSP